MAKSEGQRQSLKQENRLAKTLGGSRNAGSGSFWVRKGDVRTDSLLIEAKWTGKSQFTLKAEVIEKAMTEALLAGRIGVLGISLNGKDYVCLEESDFLEMHERLKKDDEN